MHRCPFAFLTLIACTAAIDAHELSSRTPVSVADVIRQVIIGTPDTLSWDDSQSEISTQSPDGQQVAVVIRYGDLKEGTNNAELLVYRVAELLVKPRARAVAKFASSTNYQPVALVRWLRDGRTIVFAATRGNEPSQIYRANTFTGEVKPLTKLSSQLVWYDVTDSGDWLATINEPSLSAMRKDYSTCLQEACLVTEDTFYAAQHGGSEASSPVVLRDLKKGTEREFAPPESSDPQLVDCRNELRGGISPDGRFGLRLCKLRRPYWPSWWSDYAPNPEVGKALAQGAGYLRQWVLYDFEQNTFRRLTAAPYIVEQYRGSPPLWVDGGQTLILAGGLEPLINVDESEKRRRANQYAILSIDPRTGQVARIDELSPSVRRITSVSWNQRTETLSVRTIDETGSALPSLIYHRNRGGWIKKVMPSSEIDASVEARREGVRLVVKQSLNDPPMLIAVDARSGATKTVLDPNPWLAEKALGHVEAISWTSAGRKWKGGLYYPRNYKAGAVYPLVLQTHGFNDNVFSLNGVARNFAAQPLAGLDMFVLQIDENTKGVTGAAAEWPVAQAGYEAAIDYLNELGLIDADRVGLHGWSRSGGYAGYALTQSSYKFAAGVFTETADFGWWSYMLEGGTRGATEYGEPPFGSGFDVWRRMSPSFNLQRVRAPVLMWNDDISPRWDWYIGLRRLGKPVEYWSSFEAAHDVFKVRQRMLVNTLVVDWFRFWLKDEEDSDPTKADQYRRWRVLRQQRDSESATTQSRLTDAH